MPRLVEEDDAPPDAPPPVADEEKVAGSAHWDCEEDYLRDYLEIKNPVIGFDTAANGPCKAPTRKHKSSYAYA